MDDETSPRVLRGPDRSARDRSARDRSARDRSDTDNDTGPPVLRLHHADDLVEAIPYLIGFKPRDSVVLVGIEGAPGPVADAGGRVRITVRMDIADLCAPEPIPPYGAAQALSTDDGAQRAAQAIRRSGATAVVGVVFADDDAALAQADEAARRAGRACAEVGMELGDLVVVTPAREPGEHDRPASRVAAEATYAGLVARDDRHDVVEVLNPEPAAARVALRPALLAEERLVSGDDGEGRRRRRSAIRALFAATRTLAVIDEDQLVRFGAALRTIEVRDACWLAAEAGRVDGEPLWRELGRRLPAPYDAAPLFLFGWQRWRQGDGVLAGIAARRALDSEPGYNAASLLQLAVTDGLDPFRTPRLRKGA